MSVLAGAFLRPALGSHLLQDTFVVLRRTEQISQGGVVAQPPATATFRTTGIVGPSTINDLQRLPDTEFMQNSITIVTQFRLQGPSPGFMPDQIIWHDNTYVVRDVNDWSAYGPGYVSVIAQMVDSLPGPTAPFVAAPGAPP